MKIYLVTRGTDAYEDREIDTLFAYEDKEEAEKMVLELQEVIAKELSEVRKDMKYDEWLERWEPFSLLECNLRNVDYWIEETDLKFKGVW